MEFIDPLASDASSPLQDPHVGPHGKVICLTMVTIVCECGKPAEIIVDLHVQVYAAQFVNRYTMLK